jgi:hypothetical protein
MNRQVVIVWVSRERREDIGRSECMINGESFEGLHRILKRGESVGLGGRSIRKLSARKLKFLDIPKEL